MLALNTNTTSGGAAYLLKTTLVALHIAVSIVDARNAASTVSPTTRAATLASELV